MAMSDLEAKKAKLRKFVAKLQNGKKKSITTDVYMGKDIPPEKVLSTGFRFIDWFLNGGWRRGRHHLIYGAPSAGKSSLMIMSAKRMIEAGMIVQYNDVEDFLTMDYLEKLGIDLEMFVWSSEKSATKILNTAIEFAKSNMTDVMIIDTVAAMSLPNDIADANVKYKTVGEQDVAKLAAAMTDYFRKINNYMRQSKLVTIYLQQIRDRGVGGNENYDPMFYRDGVSINGGKSMLHNAALSMFIKRSSKSQIRDSGKMFIDPDTGAVTGFSVSMFVRKSKFDKVKEGNFINLEFFYDSGFNDRTSAFEYAVANGIINKGSWSSFEYQGYSVKENGIGKLRTRIQEDDEFFDKLMDCLWDNRSSLLHIDETVQQEEIESEAEVEAKPEVETEVQSDESNGEEA